MFFLWQHHVVFSVTFTRFVLKRSKAAKSSVSAGHALVGPGLGAVYPGAVEVPEDETPQCQRKMSNMAVSCMWWLWACVTWQIQVQSFRHFNQLHVVLLLLLACGEPVFLEDASVTVDDLFKYQRKPRPKILKNVLDMVQTDKAGDSASDA